VRQLLPYPAEDLTDDDLVAAYAVPSGQHLRVNFVSSADGAVTLEGRSGGLGGPGDRRVFQLLRDLADVILVAAGTVRNEGYGYPKFGSERRARRLAAGRQEWPTFAVVSRRLELDLSSTLFTDPPVRTVVIAGPDSPADRRAELERCAQVLVVDDLPIAVAQLHRRGPILCEGGPSLFAALVGDGLVDELCLTVSPVLAGPGPGRIESGPPHPAARLTLAGLLEEDGALFTRYAVTRPDARQAPAGAAVPGSG
jgi:riboflavin biosynthesis pyrimidine reductase